MSERMVEAQLPVTIAGTGSYVPERVLSNADLQQMVDTTDEWIITRTGIRERRIAAKDFGEWSDLNLVASAGGWEHVVLANSHNEKYERFHGMNMAEIAAELGHDDPYDTAIDIMLAGIPNRAVAFYFMMSEDDVRTALRFPWTSIGSDAGAAVTPGKVDALGLPHPRSYGTFPRIISEYVRETGTLTLPDAVRKMTSLPATKFGFMDRGVIREGAWADIVIFDYDTIRDTATWTDAIRYPEGIDAVIVNGVIVARDGEHTGATPGHVLRGPGYKR